MNEGTIVKFSFRGDDLNVVGMGEDVGVALRPLCEDVFGIDFSSQRQRLQRAAELGARWACVVMTTTQVSGQRREVLVLPRASLPMFTATIDASRVRPEVQAKLIAYQNEAADVLAAHFLRPRQPAAPSLTAEGVRAIAREEARLALAELHWTRPRQRSVLPSATLDSTIAVDLMLGLLDAANDLGRELGHAGTVTAAELHEALRRSEASRFPALRRALRRLMPQVGVPSPRQLGILLARFKRKPMPAPDGETMWITFRIYQGESRWFVAPAA